MTKTRFAEIRKANGLTQVRLAEVLGYKRSITISDKERGVLPVTKRDAILMLMLPTLLKPGGKK